MTGKITREKYEQIKPHIKIPADDAVAMKTYGIGKTTARKIRNTKDYDEYCARTFRYHGYPGGGKQKTRKNSKDRKLKKGLMPGTGILEFMPVSGINAEEDLQDEIIEAINMAADGLAEELASGSIDSDVEEIENIIERAQSRSRGTRIARPDNTFIVLPDPQTDEIARENAEERFGRAGLWFFIGAALGLILGLAIAK